ncbi:MULTISPECIES: UPF0149 family protein [Pseudoalteromonas]|uniref:UPF0149 family protein n=1 Tax=Pseudoalteromonas TaxID=53246 RepID=UPI0015FC3A72|nr:MULTISPECIES: UPF0149 family protein [Pseudoalteromonas]MBB1405439.1 UPF0149 family protein [Pseudoalteromonas sp. SG44-5]MBE0420296.1 UPF0149 family protein [Pseudoalteromonas nigrifaciens]MBH0071819.1 UPF0149 family protein [Pseudoalteromonas sp. NZS127]MBH0092476.1 UPF0149 family protein [Pseudoalteromonas sp. SCQQ13]
MSDLPDYEEAQLLLEKNEIFVSPAEAHGVISGLLACGLTIDDKEYLGLLSDVFNDGDSFSNNLKQFFGSIYKQVVASFNDEEFAFDLFLPSDDETLIDQANGLVSWVAGFMLGFGLKQKDYGKLSADVKEVITDFSEITRLDTTFEETEEDSQALHEVIEYVRVSALLCFAELGKDQSAASTKKTLH